MSNTYCDTLGIPEPLLEDVVGHREASNYTLLIVALLEKGSPMALEEVARRFEDVGVAPAEYALRSLKRCRPARAPVYRDGDLYALDPHDDDLDLWAFRLGLRPAKVAKLSIVKPEPPLPKPDVPLSMDELAEAFKDAYLGANWSAQRLAIAMLDAHGGPMSGADVVAVLNRLTTEHGLKEGAADHWGRNAPISSAGGTWIMDIEHQTVASARVAVRERLETSRRWETRKPDPSVMAANRKRMKKLEAAKREELAALRRALLYVFPEKAPKAAVLVDIKERDLKTYLEGELDDLRSHLEEYDLIGAVNVRAVLRALGVDSGKRRLSDLGPPQKTRQLNRAGRKLKITLKLLVQGTCGISRPFAEPKKLREYLKKGQETKLRRRLEADAKSLFALYQYGLLHGEVRLRWGFLDERLPVAWKHWEEPGLHSLMEEAHKKRLLLEVATGTTPGWAEPWSRARRCEVEMLDRYSYSLFDEHNVGVDPRDVQLARLAPL